MNYLINHISFEEMHGRKSGSREVRVLAEKTAALRDVWVGMQAGGKSVTASP